MTAQKTVVVKLGGAAITNKKGVCELVPKERLEVLLDQVAFAYKELARSGHRLVIIHGAGSFGHPQAKKYHLKTGWKHQMELPNASFVEGMAHIRTCLTQLHEAVLVGLTERGVPALGMSPIDYIETDDCENTPTERYKPMVTRVNYYLDTGFVPVLHGDCVLDTTRGCTILSGDVIMYQMAKLVPNVSRCLFITDVPGIYKADPKLNIPESHELIQHILVKQTGEVAWTSQQAEITDVTGGMQGKVNWAKKMVLLNRNLDAIICCWGSLEALEMLKLGKSLHDGNKPIPGYSMTVFTME